jgi:hypothetical protein
VRYILVLLLLFSINVFAEEEVNNIYIHYDSKTNDYKGAWKEIHQEYSYIEKEFNEWEAFLDTGSGNCFIKVIDNETVWEIRPLDRAIIKERADHIVNSNCDRAINSLYPADKQVHIINRLFGYTEDDYNEMISFIQAKYDERDVKLAEIEACATGEEIDALGNVIEEI